MRAFERIAKGSPATHPRLAAGKYRYYNYGSLRDLLRVIRNKHNHFRCGSLQLPCNSGGKRHLGLAIESLSGGQPSRASASCRELPPDLQKKLGPLPGGFLRYFAGRYPGLLMTCYYFALRWCAHEHVFQARVTLRQPARHRPAAPRQVHLSGAAQLPAHLPARSRTTQLAQCSCWSTWRHVPCDSRSRREMRLIRGASRHA